MRLIISLFLILSLSSCASEEFSVSSLSMNTEGEDMFINAEFSPSDSTYTFRLVSPDGDLVWEGGFLGSDSEKKSEELELTAGATFPEGLYSIIIYSDKGNEITDTISFSY